jgi:hypothetical protein
MKLHVAVLLAQGQGTGEMPPDWAIHQAATLWAEMEHLPGAVADFMLNVEDSLPVINVYPNPRKKVGPQALSVHCEPEGHAVYWVHQDADGNLEAHCKGGFGAAGAKNLILKVLGVTKLKSSEERRA